MNILLLIYTWHLKQSGCQSFSNAVKRWAVVSPSLGAIGRLHAQHLGAYFLERNYDFVSERDLVLCINEREIHTSKMCNELTHCSPFDNIDDYFYPL